MARQTWLSILFTGLLAISLVLPRVLLRSDAAFDAETLAAFPPPDSATPTAEEQLPPVLRRSLEEAQAHLDGGRFRAALRIYEKAMAAAEEHPVARMTALAGEGLAFKKLGDFHQALYLYHEALAIARRREEREAIAPLLRNVGSCYTSLGEFELAMDAFEEVLASHPSRWYQSITQCDIATLHDLEGNHQQALEDLRQAFAVEWGDRATAPQTRRRGAAMILDRLGSAAWNAGHLQKAQRAYESSQSLLRGGPSVSSLAILESNLGLLHLELGAPQKALALLRPARQVLAEQGLRQAEAAALQGIAQAHQQSGDPELAAEALEQAMQLVEDLRSAVRNPHLRSVFLASHRKIYDLAIQLAMGQFTATSRKGASNEAFLHRALELSERAKARSLLDLLREGPRFPRRREDPALEARLHPLELELNQLEHQRLALVARHAPLGELAAVEKQQRALILENEDAWNAQRADDQRPPAPLDLPRIQALLDEETRFLVYSLGEPTSYLWLVGGQEIKAWPLPGKARLESLAERVWRGLTLSDQPGGGDTGPLEELSTLLLPLDLNDSDNNDSDNNDPDSLASRRLVVVPEGALHAIPFAALHDPRTGRPLVYDHEIVSLPSISVLEVLRWREAARKPGNGLVAVVFDPVYGPRDQRLEGNSAVSTLDPSWRNLPRLPRLVHSAPEAAAILGLVPGAQGLGLSGFAARREALLEGRLRGFQVVHLSVHAELDEERPELSSLVFSQVDAQGHAQDGRLFMHEIDDLELPAELVVLSACNSARGRMIRGEGLVGLTRAVFLAGANRALVSLWSVDDEATAELMTAFYSGLLTEGLSPAQALRAAQGHMLASERWQAPYFWAGFVLQGDWRWRLSAL